ncbi:hypothetical protein ABG768_001571, partial [Culter alburnus]
KGLPLLYIVLISAGSLLIVAAVVTCCICKKCRKTVQTWEEDRTDSALCKPTTRQKVRSLMTRSRCSQSVCSIRRSVSRRLWFIDSTVIVCIFSREQIKKHCLSAFFFFFAVNCLHLGVSFSILQNHFDFADLKTLVQIKSMALSIIVSTPDVCSVSYMTELHRSN